MDRARVGAVLLVVGLLVAAHPVYLDLNPGDTTVEVAAEPADGGIAEDEVTNASSLDEPAKTTLQEAADGDRATRWRGADSAAVVPLIEADCVRLDGQVYRVQVFPTQGLFDRVDTVVSPFVALVGVLAALIGGRTIWDVGVPTTGRRDREA
ncbi:hypothetical protein [Haloarchaeobius iranensis]|uniref:Uncharacterized protein n=1 Tax=Haloarchaeobius iranensis TaxID=996166 RepID=A0A1G9S9U4_9EURY|nr:hypothetical protein [Haloarchaeobius iranensis]SDM32172.1 hypothetical protein SAMN05192554_10133 [Haloarchaeobius iranensis]